MPAVADDLTVGDLVEKGGQAITFLGNAKDELDLTRSGERLSTIGKMSSGALAIQKGGVTGGAELGAQLAIAKTIAKLTPEGLLYGVAADYAAPIIYNAVGKPIIEEYRSEYIDTPRQFKAAMEKYRQDNQAIADRQNQRWAAMEEFVSRMPHATNAPGKSFPIIGLGDLSVGNSQPGDPTPDPSAPASDAPVLSVVAASNKWRFHDLSGTQNSGCEATLSSEHPEDDIFKAMGLQSSPGYKCPQSPVKSRMSDTEYIYKQTCSWSSGGYTGTLENSLYVSLIDKDHIQEAQIYIDPVSKQQSIYKGELIRCTAQEEQSVSEPPVQ